MSNPAPQSFDSAEKARVYGEYFEQGAVMWQKFAEIVRTFSPTPDRLLDLGSGPGEPGCTLAAQFRCETVLSDVAPPMVALAAKRIATKGLSQAEAKTLDLTDLSELEDESFDVVTASHCLQFCPDKATALREVFRVLRPGGLFVAAVWEEVGLMAIAGGIMRHVTDTISSVPPAFNPNGPLGLRDPEVFDDLLRTAGLEFTSDHNMLDEYPAVSLGPLEGDTGFKVAMLPIWDAVQALQSSGEVEDAWSRASKAWTKVGASRVNAQGNVTFSGRMRYAIVVKPAA